MRQVHGDQLSDFAAIYEEDVEIVSVTRPQAQDCESLSKELIRSRQLPELRWVQQVDDHEAARNVLPTTIESDSHSVLCNQITEASEMLGALTECRSVGIRLMTLSAPMCPRFHVDHIPCRMLITLCGVGTDWIKNREVDWDVLDDLQTSAPPIQENRQIQRLSTGNWSILKGGAWKDGYRGVVHRSPHDVGERLLLSLDPVY